MPGQAALGLYYPAYEAMDGLAADYRAVFPAGSYPALVVSDGAVAYWRLGETSGTTAIDNVGGNNGTISGGVTLNQPGPWSGNAAMAFDGTSGQIALGTVAALNITSDLTIEAWAYKTASAVFGMVL